MYGLVFPTTTTTTFDGHFVHPCSARYGHTMMHHQEEGQQPQRSPPPEPPSTTCRCKRPRCPDCLKCSRCGCCFIHTETQDGKSVLDAHFAQAMKRVKSWVRQGHNCVTPTQLVVGLTSGGGTPNTFTDLIEYDREKLGESLDQLKGVISRVSKSLGRTNDILYEYAAVDSTNESSVNEMFNLSNLLPPDYSSRILLFWCGRRSHGTRCSCATYG